jgi:hypothetical protein
MSWVAVEVAGTAVLLWEKPLLGTMVVAIGASLFGQKIFARRSPA